MNDSFSQNLLLAIVHGLRNACNKNIKSENFTVISGFLSCDIDGKVQHRFVINELISRENSGEGHSSCLKVIDWNYLSRRLNSQRNERNWKQSSMNQSPVIYNQRVKNCRGGSIKSRCVRAATKIKQKGLNGPISHSHFQGSRNKRSSQTFTLEDFQLPSCPETRDCNLARNFSSATISIASQKISQDQQISTEMSSVQNPPKLSSSHKICNSLSQPVKSLCDECGNENHEASCLNNNLSGRLSQGSHCSQVKINSNFIVTEVKSMSKKGNFCSKGHSISQKSSISGRDDFKAQNTVQNSRKNTQQIFKLSHSLTSGDSDISIDSIRPRYLVQHNDDLLLPCPNLSSKYNKHLAATKNNNRAHSVHRPSQSSEESVPHASHISTLFSSIIGALSYSNSVNVHETPKKTCTVPVDLNVGKLKGSAEIDGSSNDSLKSVSSLETDSLKSGFSKIVETPNGRFKIRTKKTSYGRSTDNKEIGMPSTGAKKSKFSL